MPELVFTTAEGSKVSLKDSSDRVHAD